MSQDELDDLVRDLCLPKLSAELLASQLKEKHFLATGVRVSAYRVREAAFLQFFPVKRIWYMYCKDIQGLVEQMGTVCMPIDWRLFIESSKRSLKAVLLHNGNKLASVPLAHSVKLREAYESMSFLLHEIVYADHEWDVCGDLKVISLILSQQAGYTKYPCFLCLWDSRANQLQYNQQEWESRTEFIPGMRNIKHTPLIAPTKVLLPPLH